MPFVLLFTKTLAPSRKVKFRHSHNLSMRNFKRPTLTGTGNLKLSHKLEIHSFPLVIKLFHVSSESLFLLQSFPLKKYPVFSFFYPFYFLSLEHHLKMRYIRTRKRRRLLNKLKDENSINFVVVECSQIYFTRLFLPFCCQRD